MVKYTMRFKSCSTEALNSICWCASNFDFLRQSVVYMTVLGVAEKIDYRSKDN